MKRRLLSAADAVPAKGQHVKPCSDCPWSRRSLPGWLGDMSPEEWLQAAHGEAVVECHCLSGAQCAGLAIYRANVAKTPRNPQTLRLPKNISAVFAAPGEFRKHHDGEKVLFVEEYVIPNFPDRKPRRTK